MTFTKNPFADCGLPVFGQRFVGRGEQLKLINQYVIGPNSGGNLAIIGLPSIGKSSLIRQFLHCHESKMISKRVLPLELTVATLPDSKEFFLALINQPLRELERLSMLDSASRLYDAGLKARKAIEEHEQSNEAQKEIEEFFKTLKDEQWKCLFVLDQFDYASKLFRDVSWPFQRLLSLLDNRLIFVVTISKRPIKEIEQAAKGLSDLPRRLTPEYLPMFSSSDVDEVFKRFAHMGDAVSENFRERAIAFCGGHPYLLDMFCARFADQMIVKSSIDLDDFCRSDKVLQYFDSCYKQIIDWLNEIGRLPKLLEVARGSQGAVPREDLNYLARYDLIKEERGQYVLFSEHFKNYLLEMND